MRKRLFDIFEQHCNGGKTRHQSGDAFGTTVEPNGNDVTSILKLSNTNADQLVRVNEKSGKLIANKTTKHLVREHRVLRIVHIKTLLRVLSEHTVVEGESRTSLELSYRR